MTQASPDSSGRLVAARYPHLALLALLAIYLAVSLAYGLLYPLGEASDEIAHVDLIRFIGERGHLPRNETERQAAGYKSAWPMLYHALIGAATSWVDYDVLPQLRTNDASPRRLLIEDGLSPFALIHTEDERFPYQGIVLSWHLARLASTLLSAATLVFIYRTVLAVYPGQRWLALGATAIAAAIPQFHFVASVASDDNLLGLLSAMFTFTLIQAWQQPQRHSTYAWLGLWLGLALVTKYSVGLLPLLVVVLLACALRRGTLGWRAALSRLLLFCLVLMAAAGWWFVYVEWYFNEVKELGLVAGLIKPLMSTGTSDASTQLLASALTAGAIATPELSLANATLWDWATHLFRSFWLLQGEATPVVTALSLALLGLCGLAIAGLWRTWRRDGDLPRPVLGLLVLQIGLLLPFPLLRFHLILSPAETGQGRHILFPAATAVGLLLAQGISAWFSSAQRRFAGPVVAGVLLVVSLVSFFGDLLPAFPPQLPVRASTNALAAVPNPIHVAFERGIELAGYQVGEANTDGTLPVTLFWHSLAATDQNYLVELSLLDEANVVRSLWLGYPIDGHYPTHAWEAGDVVRDTIWLPLVGLPAGDYQFHLRLRPVAELGQGTLDNTQLGPTNQAGFLLPTRYSLSTPYSLLLPPPSGPLGGYSVTLWQAGQPASGQPTYRYRAAIPITVQHQTSDLGSLTPKTVSLISPDGVQQTSQAHAGYTYIFLVGPRWASGEYRLRLQGTEGEIESGPILRVWVRPRNFDVPPMSAEVRANFNDEIMLLGYDFPERKVQPGGALPITLYWQALRPMNHNYVVSNHLLYSADLRQWGGRDRVPQDYYSTTLWVAGEVVRDEYQVPVASSAPPGVYRLDIGLYVSLFGQAWHLPLVADGKTLEANSVTIAPIKVAGPPPGVAVTDPAPQYSQTSNLANLVTLLGYDMSLEPGELHLTLYWHCDVPLLADYTTFVHVRDATGQVTGQPGTIVAQMDRPPVGGAYPTSLWDPGEIIRDSIQVPVPSQVPSGRYEIIVGLYDLTTGARLGVFDDRGQPLGDYVRLDREVVVP